jgi:hypothetical protein
MEKTSDGIYRAHDEERKDNARGNEVVGRKKDKLDI